MPEHVHLLIYPTEDNYEMSKILRSIKQPVARKTLNYVRKNNPAGLKLFTTGNNNSQHRFWQGGGRFDRNVIVTKGILNVAHYIHNNPVRRGFVSDPIEWHWSSAREWAGIEVESNLIDKKYFPV